MRPAEATEAATERSPGAASCPRCEEQTLTAQVLPSGLLSLVCVNANCRYSQDLAVHDQAPAPSSHDLAPEFNPIQELPPERSGAPTLPPELLPSALRPWLADIAERMQVPLELVAIPALAALASAVGRRFGIHPKAQDDWLVIPNLWGGIVARPGMLKSPTLTQALRPLRRLDEEAQRNHEAEVVNVQTQLDVLKAREAAAKTSLRRAFEAGHGSDDQAQLEQDLREVQEEIREAEEGLVVPRSIVNDTTVEKLGELLAQHPQGLLLERDELAGWLRSLERSDRKGDREFFLEAWNGLNPYTYDRIGRGTIRIPALCLSIIGGIQPAKLSRHVSEALEGGYAADGLLQRFQLLVWPEDPRDWRLIDRPPDCEAAEAVLQTFSTVRSLTGEHDEEEELSGPTVLRFSPEAQELFYEWFTQLEWRLRSPELKRTPAFESHLAKYRSLMPTLALLFHLVEVVGTGSIGPVSLAAARLAEVASEGV